VEVYYPENSSNYHLNLELKITHMVMESVKNYDINVPEVVLMRYSRRLKGPKVSLVQLR